MEEPHRDSADQAGDVASKGWRRRSEPAVLGAIAAGGALGAPARYGLAQLIHVTPDGFPWATFWTNISGSFAIGALLALILERFPSNRYVGPFLATGFLGGYTTYSTFAVESDLLVKNGHASIAAAYGTASLLVGFMAVWAGMWAARTVGRGHRHQNVSPFAWVAFVAAAAIGSPLRYVIDGYIGDRVGGTFPWGTLFINATGSFLLGLLSGLALYHGFPKTPRVILGAGFCGAYTTFSTFAFETVRLAEGGTYGDALRNARPYPHCYLRR